MASAIPVLPEVASTTVWPGLRRPLTSASWMMAQASRSLTDAMGLKASTFTKRWMSLGASRLRRTIGVLPMVETMLSWIMVLLSGARGSEIPGRRHGRGGEHQQHHDDPARGAESGLELLHLGRLLRRGRSALGLDCRGQRAQSPGRGGIHRQPDHQGHDGQQPAGAECHTRDAAHEGALEAGRVMPIEEKAGEAGDEPGAEESSGELADPGELVHERAGGWSHRLDRGEDEAGEHQHAPDPEDPGADMEKAEHHNNSGREHGQRSRALGSRATYMMWFRFQV